MNPISRTNPPMPSLTQNAAVFVWGAGNGDGRDGMAPDAARRDGALRRGATMEGSEPSLAAQLAQNLALAGLGVPHSGQMAVIDLTVDISLDFASK